MKVIEKGREQTGWSTEARCTGVGNRGGGCGALLLVERYDLFQTESSCRDETTYYTTFRCPECGVLTDLPDAPRFRLPSKQAWFEHHGVLDVDG